VGWLRGQLLSESWGREKFKEEKGFLDEHVCKNTGGLLSKDSSCDNRKETYPALCLVNRL